ncbi:hypothetical protein, partial [Comamonas sp.]|uniref:hypothetical protein n=1 Tax=Comamonas sp. TaxID=34028 RepID=UPI0026478048
HQQLAQLFCQKQVSPLKWRIFQNLSIRNIFAFFIVFQNFIDINFYLPSISAIFQRISNIQYQPTKRHEKPCCQAIQSVLPQALLPQTVCGERFAHAEMKKPRSAMQSGVWCSRRAEPP